MLIGHLYLLGGWSGADLRTDMKKAFMCLKEIGLHAQNLLTILGLSVNIIGGCGLPMPHC
jgi:hypothetical protein